MESSNIQKVLANGIKGIMIAELTVEKQNTAKQEPVDMEKIKAYVRYCLEHLDELLLNYSNPVLQAKYFGVIFNTAPTYEDIVSGTPDCSKLTGVNEVFKTKMSVSGLMAGDTSLNWHPLLSDFTLLGQKLEQLGFTYFKGKVTVIDPAEVQ